MSKPYQPTVLCPRCGSATKCDTYEPRTRLEERTCRDHRHYFKRERPTRAESVQARRGWIARSESLRQRYQRHEDRRLAAELAARLPKLDDPPPSINYCPRCGSAATDVLTPATGTQTLDEWGCDDCQYLWTLPASERQ